jgi:hypothetical protein
MAAWAKLQMHNPECCDRRGCALPVITTLGEEALCLDHFCSRSYEFLNGMDERGQPNAARRLPTTEQIRTADECARKTLDICMSKLPLNNLERARLLDILLWCGDVVSSLGPKRNAPRSPQAHGPHEKSASRLEASRIAIRN